MKACRWVGCFLRLSRCAASSSGSNSQRSGASLWFMFKAITAVLFRRLSSECRHSEVYLFCWDVSKQSITSICNVTDFVQIYADFIGWKTICLNVGQIVGLRTLTARDGGLEVNLEGLASSK